MSDSQESTWAVFAAHEIVRCPGLKQQAGFTVPCKAYIGKVGVAGVVRVRILRLGLAPLFTPRRCTDCKSDLELQTYTRDEYEGRAAA